MSFWYYTSFPSSRTTFGILGGIRYSFWTISHFIFLTPLQIQEGTPLEIPRWSCFFNTWFSDGSTSLLLLFRAFVLSHPYVPWSLFNSSWVTLHFPLASMSFTYLVLLSFDLQLFFLIYLYVLENIFVEQLTIPHEMLLVVARSTLSLYFEQGKSLVHLSLPSCPILVSVTLYFLPRASFKDSLLPQLQWALPYRLQHLGLILLIGGCLRPSKERPHISLSWLFLTCLTPSHYWMIKNLTLDDLVIQLIILVSETCVSCINP